MIAFQTTKHTGSLGKSFSLVHFNNSRIRVLALKKAEDSDEVILRMVELDGKAATGRSRLLRGSCCQCSRGRRTRATYRTSDSYQWIIGDFVYAIPATHVCIAPQCGAGETAVDPIDASTLDYDLAIATNDDTKTTGGGFDGKGNAIPAEMLPATIQYRGVEFELAASKTGTPNAIVAKGQTITLPAGHYNRVYLLAASADGDQDAAFVIGNRKVNLNIQDWSGFIGQWDTRKWKQQPERDWAISANHAPWPPADEQERENALFRRVTRKTTLGSSPGM